MTIMNQVVLDLDEATSASSLWAGFIDSFRFPIDKLDGYLYFDSSVRKNIWL
jgi:hypothetical protein